MNLQNILNEIEQVDADMYERLDHVSRRHVFSNFLKKAMAGAAPVAFAAILNKSYAQNSSVADVLNFALLLEYLEAEFYNKGLAAPGLIPSGVGRNVYDQIAKHENAHVALLRSALGGAAIAKPNFDLTYKGAFADVLTNYQTYLAVSQALEDTGVRAYKGQAGALISAPAVLTVALQIHSVEARHAARVRMLRGQKGYIVNADAGGVPAAVYAGEDNVTQGGVNLVSATGYSMARVTEAFDEPLTKAQVLAIATPFLA
ncbi:ferritin-like domain-containing protein [Spirosoma pomorum]